MILPILFHSISIAGLNDAVKHTLQTDCSGLYVPCVISRTKVYGSGHSGETEGWLFDKLKQAFVESAHNTPLSHPNSPHKSTKQNKTHTCACAKKNKNGRDLYFLWAFHGCMDIFSTFVQYSMHVFSFIFLFVPVLISYFLFFFSLFSFA